MKVWNNAFLILLKKNGEGEALFWPPGASFSCLFTAVSANHFRCFQKQRMSFDFIENEFKPEASNLWITAMAHCISPLI